jgi:hypothetical protein
MKEHKNDDAMQVLELNVQQREEWLKKIAAFMRTIVLERGASKHESEWRTAWTLTDFGGFDFRATFGLTMFGGDRYELWWKAFHDQSRPTNFGPFADPDLSMEVRDEGKFTAVRLRGLPDWKDELETVIAYKDEIVAAIEYDKANKAEAQRLESATVAHRTELENRALELGIR